MSSTTPSDPERRRWLATTRVEGDNIAPPQRALGWLQAVYADTADVEQAFRLRFRQHQLFANLIRETGQPSARQQSSAHRTKV